MSQTILNGDEFATPNGYIEYLAGRWQHSRKFKKSRDQEFVNFVAYPEPRKRLIKELKASQHIGETPDGKQIYLFDYRINSSVIRELGRLRELTFRAVGEGTKRIRDTDKFDKTYRHIVLWDENASEIIGAYRIGEAFKLGGANKLDQLYTNRLFSYQHKFLALFPNAIELGRSFIQPKYWTRRGLDYLWLGIGAYLKAHPQIRYMFGAVSISNDFPALAKQQIVGCYQHFFQPEDAKEYAFSKLPFDCERSVIESYRDMTYPEAVRSLKTSLSQQNVTLPTLYKHYAELCEPAGTKFIDFNIDPEFSYCIDGLMLVDLKFIKPSKSARYLSI